MRLIHITGELYMDSFLRTPRFLIYHKDFCQLSPEARFLYTIMLDRASVSVANQWMDYLGRAFIYFTVDEVQQHMNCATGKAIKLLRELEEVGLIVRHRQGQGKPSIIFVKFPAEFLLAKPEVPNPEFLDTSLCNDKRLKPRAANLETPDFSNSEANNKEINKNNKNNIYGVNPCERAGAQTDSQKGFLFRLLGSRH